MPENGNICKAHSGCISDIDHLKSENLAQWKELSKVQEKQDQLLMRMNVLLGGIAVACVLLVINIAIKI